jgi:hypothetical protein
MAKTDLLAAVLPPDGEGNYCIVGLKSNGYPKQEFADTLLKAGELIDDLLSQKFDVYFACAKYLDPNEGRTQKNSAFFKSFWIDIDCGVDKPYENQ